MPAPHARVLALAVVLTVAATGCGITGEAADAPTTRAELRRALLTAEEVGQDFAVDEDEDDGADTEFDVSGNCRRLVDQFESQADRPPAAKVDFENRDTQSTVGQSLHFARDLAPTLGEYLRFMRTCGDLPFARDAGTMRLSGERVDGLGDDAIRIRAEVEVQGLGPGTLRIRGSGYLWIHDNVAAQVFAFDGLSVPDLTPIRLPAGFARKLAEKADRKLARVLDD